MMLPAKVKCTNFITSAFKFLPKSITQRLIVWTLETESLGANHISATQLPDLGQVTYLLFFNFLICKMGIISVYSVGKLQGLYEIIFVKHLEQCLPQSTCQIKFFKKIIWRPLGARLCHIQFVSYLTCLILCDSLSSKTCHFLS